MTYAVDFRWKTEGVDQSLLIPLTKHVVTACKKIFKSAPLCLLFKEEKGRFFVNISFLNPQSISTSYQFELNQNGFANSSYPPNNHVGNLTKINKVVSPLLPKTSPKKSNLPPPKVPVHLATSVYDISPEQTSPLPAPPLNPAPPSPLQLPDPATKPKTNSKPTTRKKTTKSNTQKPGPHTPIKKNASLKQTAKPTPVSTHSFCHKIFEAICHILIKIISFIRGDPLA